MLNSFAQRLNQNPWMRQLLFLASALTSIFIIGYHFGTFDQAIHIPFLKASVDPTLFPNDPFFSLRFTHYSYFWVFFRPFYQWGILEPTMFVVHLLATHLTFWAVWKLSMTLFDDPLAALIAVVSFIMPHIGFAGFPILEFSLLNRTFVLPFLLLALDCFLNRRYWFAFLLLGLLYNLHVISVNFVLAMVLFDALVEFRRIGWRNLAAALGLFLLAALPVLVWKFSSSGSSGLSLEPEWLSVVARGTIYNIFYLVAPYPHIILATASGLSGIALLFVARVSLPKTPHDRTILSFIVAIFLVLAVQVITSYWMPITLIIQSQIIRVGLFGVVFGYIYFSAFLARLYRHWLPSRLDFALPALATIFSTLPIVPLVTWAVQRYFPSTQLRRAALTIWITLSWFAAVAVILFYQLWAPGIFIYGHRTPWYDVQIWARDHTPKEARFITPPENWWFYESEWRVFSERSTVTTLSELLEAAFEPEYMEIWTPRFNALAPGAVEQFQGNYFDNVEITARVYSQLSDAELVRIAKDYGASYLVVKKPAQRNFPIVYENPDYIVYDLRGSTQ